MSKVTKGKKRSWMGMIWFKKIIGKENSNDGDETIEANATNDVREQDINSSSPPKKKAKVSSEYSRQIVLHQQQSNELLQYNENVTENNYVDQYHRAVSSS